MGAPTRDRRIGIQWLWPEALRGALCALPAVPVLIAVDVSLGICVALGTLPVALLGVPPARRARPRMVAIGVLFAASYLVGSVLGQWPVAAVAAAGALGYAGVVLAARRPPARLLPGLLMPAFVLGMNEPPSDALVLAAMFAAGGVWATLVAYCWPDAEAPVDRPPQRPSPAAEVRAYAVGFGAAAALGLGFGFVLELDHLAWAAAAAIIIMRPDPGLLIGRAVGRSLATLAGVAVASLVFHTGPAAAVLAVVVLATLAAILAVRASPWYVTAAGTGLLALLASGVAGDEEFRITLDDRLLETLVGALLAVAFGVGFPRIARRIRARTA